MDRGEPEVGMPAARFFISGRVQGVFFRASTRNEARRLGIRGWARNLADGRVEVLAQADAPAVLDELEAWLQHGPPQARVDAVIREPVDGEPPVAGFTTA